MVVVSSPNKPRPDDPLIRYVADTLRRVEINYEREGSGPGSRFEGRLLEDVQAEIAVRIVQTGEVPSVTAPAPAAPDTCHHCCQCGIFHDLTRPCPTGGAK